MLKLVAGGSSFSPSYVILLISGDVTRLALLYLHHSLYLEIQWQRKLKSLIYAHNDSTVVIFTTIQ